MRHTITYFTRIIKEYGWGAALFLIKGKFRKNKLENIYLRGIQSPLFLSNYGPDVSTLFKIFFARDYELKLTDPPRFIIDCGANIGLSTVFFAAKYPDALIIAVEPDKRNFQFLQKNTISFKNVVCINKAIWSSNTRMKVVDEGKGNWALQTILAADDEPNFIAGTSITQLLKDFNQEKIDLLKIDIEGAEKELFSFDYKPWLEKTKIIAIEIHYSEGDTIKRTFYKAMEGFKYRQYNKGENLICELY